MNRSLQHPLFAGLLLVVLAAVGWTGWAWWRDADAPAGLVSSNGRLEATEVDIASRLGGRIRHMLVDEGEAVQAGQVLAYLQVDSLHAQLREARAQQQRASQGVTVAQAQLAMRRSEQRIAQALTVQRHKSLSAATRRVERSQPLGRMQALTAQEVDDEENALAEARAQLDAAQAQEEGARAAIRAAEADVASARALLEAAQAATARIEADLEEGAIRAPRDGHIQYRLAQAGEVVSEGGKLLNLIDLSDLHMHFFLPAELAGKVRLGQEVRVVLDAMPADALLARITYVSRQAQFTPKAVETASERQKLMFRVKAQLTPSSRGSIAPHLKAGMPGVAWIKTAEQLPWPKTLPAPGQSP